MGTLLRVLSFCLCVQSEGSEPASSSQRDEMMIPTASFWPWETGGLRGGWGQPGLPSRGSRSVAEMETGCFQGFSATKQCCVSTHSPMVCPRAWEPPFVVLLLGQPWASGGVPPLKEVLCPLGSFLWDVAAHPLQLPSTGVPGALMGKPRASSLCLEPFLMLL